MRHAPGVHLLLRSPDPGSGPGASFIRKAPRAQLNLRSGVLPHPDDRSRVAAALAPQRQVADEAVPADARTARQEQPGDVGARPHPRADGPQVRVALGLALGDGPGAPVGIDSHGGDHRTLKSG